MKNDINNRPEFINSKVYFSSKGYELFLEEKILIEKRLKKFQKMMGESCEDGGETWHDNADFEEAERQIPMWKKRLSDMNHVNSIREIINPAEIDDNPDSVRLFTKIFLYNINTGNELIYNILGYGEGGTTNMDGSINITYYSPIGRKLIGKRIGKTIKHNFNSAMCNLEIEDIKKYIEPT